MKNKCIFALFMIFCIMVSVSGQNERIKKQESKRAAKLVYSDSPKKVAVQNIDSMLFVMVLSNKTVQSYFGISQNDTIYIIKNHFTEKVSQCKITNIAGKEIVFTTKEDAPIQQIFHGEHVVDLRSILAISLINQTKNIIDIWICGLRKNEIWANYCVHPKFKKRGKKYILVGCGIT